jgi:sporulation protein YqfC
VRYRKALRFGLASMFELPQDLVLDMPRITIIGSLQVTVQNHRGLLEYRPDRVVIGISGGQLLVTGEEMVIATIQEEEVCVTGILQSVVFEGGLLRPDEPDNE